MAGAVRQPIDVQALERYIDQHVPEIKTPLDLKQFGFGQSNPTYQITSATGKKYVLRKKPPGKLLSKTAHRVDREYKIIHALEKTDVPVPKAYCFCADTKVVGSEFYIMEFLDGRMITDPAMPGVSAEQRKAMWEDAVRTLAKFHRVDIAKVGLQDFGKTNGFYDRQLRTFGTISAAQAQAVDVDTKEPVGQIPGFQEMVEYFSEKPTQPKDRSTLIHGDYKIDNLVFHKTEPRVIGILDWEMATIGHPLSDFTNLTGPYTWTNITINQPDAKNEFVPGATAGIPTLDECVEWYRDDSGYDVTNDLAWGNAFGGFRGAVIMQGIAARYAVRQASSANAKDYGDKMKPYGEWTWSVVRKLKEQGSKVKL